MGSCNLVNVLLVNNIPNLVRHEIMWLNKTMRTTFFS